MFFNIKRTIAIQRLVRIVFTLIFVVVGFAAGQLPFTFVVWSKLAARDGEVSQGALNAFTSNMDFPSIGMTNNFGLILLLLSFGVGLLSLFLSVQFIHKRSWWTIIRPQSIRWSHFFFGFFVWLGILGLLEGVTYLVSPEDYTLNFQAGKWFILLIITVLFIPIQTSFEELLFRGYLMQELGVITKNRWFPLIVTSVGFGLMHIMNPEIQEFGLSKMMPYYIGMGLFLGVLTLMDDGAELAMGVHASNNIFSSLFITFKGSALQTDAFFKVKELNLDLMLPMFFVTVVIFILIAKSKYQWSDWSRLYGRVDEVKEVA